ncbi:MAG TPA: alpha-galactosidase [Limnochordia bacterium]|nr:alpha-galactosidase [Limnochordia bacterium]
MSEETQGHYAHTKEADLLGGGQTGRRIKVVMLGAGSGFTEPLMTDILNIPGLDGGELALVDIDLERLELAHQLVEKIVELMGKKGSWQVTATADRRKALPGADYIVNCIEVSGLKAVRLDYEIPLKYGVDQCIGDTVGPGGLMKALRTIPTWVEVLKDAEELCPKALVLNYTNPMGMMILAASHVSNMQVVGLCHSVQGTSHLLARHAEVPYAEMQWKCAGINHLAWFTELTHEGRDLYPILFEKAKDPNSEFYQGDPVRCDIMLHFGAFVTESSGHLSEYLPYYRKRKDLLEKYTRSGYRGESGFYANNWPKWREARDKERRQAIRGEREIRTNRSWEYASWIIEAHQTNKPFVIHGNVINHGLIDNLPQGQCVEVPVMIDRNGFNPCHFGPLPPHMAAICRSNMAMIEVAVIAALERSREAAFHALLLDPLTAAVCSPAEIKQMTEELIDSQIELLPGFEK